MGDSGRMNFAYNLFALGALGRFRACNPANILYDLM